MDIDLDILNYAFTDKPLLIGGKAMAFYGIRKAGADIDFVISLPDHRNLVAKYPDSIKDICGDIGVCVRGFELCNQICRFGYDELKEGAIEQPAFLVASPEKLVLLKTLGIEIKKYEDDLRALSTYVLDVRYGKKALPA